MPETNIGPLVLDPAGADIQGESARLRARGPVTEVELPGGVRAWSVTDAQLLRGVLTDPRISKDASRHWPAFVNGELPQDWPIITWVAVQNMFTAYGDEHRRLRKLVAPAFTARRTAALQPRIEALTKDLIDGLAATGAGEIVDVRDLFAYPLPIRVICELMGVPEDLAPRLRVCVDGIFDTSLTPEQSVANITEMYGILAGLIEFRRNQPGDDMTSLLISHRDDELGGDDSVRRLSDQELTDTLLLVISAGFETTVNLLDQAIYLLLTKPELRARVTSGEISWTDLIEETLRFEPPVAHIPLRYAVEDLELGGVRIAKGEAILTSFAAANRDPKVHGDTAAEFIPGRPNQDHLAFGYGTHHCLGAPLARMEAAAALPALFSRFPDMRLAVDPAELQPSMSFISNGHRSLPVILSD